MSSAAERAEARRKAILARGNDRLAKLTTSARGEDTAGVFRDETPPPAAGARNFLGEESSDMPAPRRFTPSPSPGPKTTESTPARNAPTFADFLETSSTMSGTTAGGSTSTGATTPMAWLPEQQAQFIAALKHASEQQTRSTSEGGPSTLPISPLGEPSMPFDPSLPPMDNPFAALLAGGGPFGKAGLDGATNPFLQPPSASQQATAPKPPSKLQKLLPLIHLISMWLLLAYFVLWVEPRAGGGVVGVGDENLNFLGLKFWRRWAELGNVQVGGVKHQAVNLYRVHLVPFFWAFTTLQIVLHSLRIFAGYDAVQPPALLSLVLPSLPAPIPSLVINSLKYAQMGSLFLDDLSGIIVGIGFIVYFSGLIAWA